MPFVTYIVTNVTYIVTFSKIKCLIITILSKFPIYLIYVLIY